ncbi:hypothetical protein [uncultured Algimonas sp.]|uniref:hypothetical protein n=1 Tax=uncultured Algimonas sp. TaxID=1547920 RepID=UPI0026035616|nr:hypothetical protein [uncultured Algimonas sp.]
MSKNGKPRPGRSRPVVGKAKPQRNVAKEPVRDTVPTPDIGTPETTALSGSKPSPGEVDFGPRLQALFEVAQNYGERSFENYSRIRSLAETLRDEFCAWLSEQPGCVFLVPPEGRFSAKNYQSAAFSVAGKGYLPLKPISFGLAVRVSQDKDFMRLKVSCRKEGDVMFVRLERGPEIKLGMPVSDDALLPLFEEIYAHLMKFFQDRIDDYDNGRYGVQEIGFDIQRMTT